MKINKLFHWLYAFLMGLPLLSSLWIGLIWTFNENSQVPTITENVSREVDFNQVMPIINRDNYTIDNRLTNVTFNNNGIQYTMDSQYGNNFAYNILSYSDIRFITNNKYYLEFDYSFIGNNTFVFALSNNPYAAQQYIVNHSFNGGSGSYSVIFEPNNDYRVLFSFLVINSSSTVSITNLECFNLTQMFGIGNEPSVTEFNTWFTDTYYDYTLSKHIVIEDYSTKQVLDSPVNYIWLPSFGGIGWTIQNVFNYMVNGMFGLATSYGIGLTIVKLLTYWLCISLIWLIYDVIMYVPLLVHRWLDKGVIS